MNSSIFGAFCRNSDQLPPLVLEKIQANISTGNKDEYQLWNDGGIALVQTHHNYSSDFHSDSCLNIKKSNSYIFIAAGRLDNVSELCSFLDIPESARPTLSDYDLMHLAYAKFGKKCSSRMFGDWVFAAWNITDRQLAICRSHYGKIALYYHVNNELFAFASKRRDLLALKLVPVELDELWLAQYIISWHAYYGEQTPHKPIKCIPPAHYLAVTRNNFFINCYWNPENNSELHLSSREKYVEEFRSIFDDAVTCRVRTDTPIAVSLSGGLDSGSVAAKAAGILATKGKRLAAFISVPLFGTQECLPSTHFGDELAFAKATADYSKNIDLFPLSSTGISPIMAIRYTLKSGCIPVHGATNLYWMMDIRQSALALGCGVLLTGAAGNGAFSWKGYPSSQPWSFMLTHLEWCTLAQRLITRSKQAVKLALPSNLLSSIKKSRLEQQGWYRQSAILPDFAQRIRLIEQLIHDPYARPPRSPREEQNRINKLGRMVVGANNAAIGDAEGLDIRDPTCDARILDFIYTVPDHIFMDPETGIDRWLVRESMKGHLPDTVRLNRKRGLQGSDIVPRLRSCAIEVECTLAELAQGSAASFVDVEHMYKVWRDIQSPDTAETRIASTVVLLRGIMAGLFVNSFYD
jgi:asparagine synthase (glutamine-hydrolysing)